MSRAPLVFGIVQKELSEYNDYKSKVRVDVEIVSDRTFPPGDQDSVSGLGSPTTTKLDFYISGKDDNELQRFNFSFIFEGFKYETSMKEYCWAPGTERCQGTYIITACLGASRLVDTTPRWVHGIAEGMKIRKCTVTLNVKGSGLVKPGSKAWTSHLQAWEYLRSYILRTTSITLNNREFTRTRDDLPEPSSKAMGVDKGHYISKIEKVEYEANPMRSALNKEIVVTHLKM